MTVSGGCIVGWYPDESIKGATNLSPVTCSTVIKSLRAIVAKTALGYPLEAEEQNIVEALAADFHQEVLAMIRVERDRLEGKSILRSVPEEPA